MDVDGAMGIHLQDEKIMDILSILPVRSLLRFKCVSKLWKRLILFEPYFKMKHLDRAKNDQNSRKFLTKPLQNLLLSRWLVSYWEEFCTFGLGYDSTSDDYKILKIDPKARGEILALKSGSWRKIDQHPSGVYPVLSGMDSLAFVNGAFHWLGLSLNDKPSHCFCASVMKDYGVKESWSPLFVL
uniref:F-box protein At5g15670 n=1 Tax=Nicotiana sylvestris TaxID=4096 RepID=A0A1U7XW18_NICSY|nr:PREDICTED: putative F-box protein At5g15670 [Nicotiana sylvestris]